MNRRALWFAQGRMVDAADQTVFVIDTGPVPEAPDRLPVVIVHGFPGSTFDWYHVMPRLAPERRVVLMDLPGFGFSSKPHEGMSLFGYADVVESVLRHVGIDRCAVVGHDIGDTVTAELVHRHNAGELGFRIDAVVLTNGSIFIDMAHLTRGQRLALALPNRRMPIPMPEFVLRRSLNESFAPESPAPPGTIDDMIALIQRNGGDRLLPVQIEYINERRRNQGRWTVAFRDYEGPFTAIWGALDPIAVVAMAHRLEELRPETTVIEWPDSGHWPSIEQPERLAAAILSATPA